MQKHDSKTPNRSGARRERPASKERRDSGAHQGAVETQVSPITPPTTGPDAQAGTPSRHNDEIDPAKELTPG
jgi:hypothetical protein